MARCKRPQAGIILAEALIAFFILFSVGGAALAFLKTEWLAVQEAKERSVVALAGQEEMERLRTGEAPAGQEERQLSGSLVVQCRRTLQSSAASPALKEAVVWFGWKGVDGRKHELQYSTLIP
nr:hypothetical protein [uncultured Anaeromusa sp.]